MDRIAQLGAVVEEDCFLTMARSIVDEILGRYGVYLAEDESQAVARSEAAYTTRHAA